MYKYLIIACALMFIGAGGYYVNNAGGGIMGNIITGNITSQESLVPLNEENIPGMYVCNNVSTCKNKYILLLKSDKTAELTRAPKVSSDDTTEDVTSDNENQPAEETSFTPEIDNNTETGNWNLDVQNMLVVTIVKQGQTDYTIPQKIVIKNVNTKTLSKISYTKTNYKDMNNPIFIRQD